VDIRDLDRLRTIVDDAVTQLGRLDVVVANAGICVPKAWDQTTPQIYEDTISTNVEHPDGQRPHAGGDRGRHRGV
jgi:NAD(P)-dependent dehydrogenase (short-subunit alcohol dehydrogenase family)